METYSENQQIKSNQWKLIQKTDLSNKTTPCGRKFDLLFRLVWPGVPMPQDVAYFAAMLVIGSHWKVVSMATANVVWGLVASSLLVSIIVGVNAELKPGNNCFCKLDETVYECPCTVDSVDVFNNNNMFPLLQALLQKDFFRYYKVLVFCRNKNPQSEIDFGNWSQIFPLSNSILSSDITFMIFLAGILM